MTVWKSFNPNVLFEIGDIPSFISKDDPRPLKEQINENYSGGWKPEKSGKFEIELLTDRPILIDDNNVHYPFVALTKIRNETFVIFKNSFCAIMKTPDMTFEVSRLDRV